LVELRKSLQNMNLIIILLLLFLILFFILFSFLFFLFGAILPLIFYGAIYVPTDKEKIKTIIRFAEIKPGEKVVDLGSGDGILVIALAKAGAETHGYEINPFLVWKARKNISKAKIENKAFIHWKSFWQEDLSDFDVVVIYGINYIMGRLEKKLRGELKKDARVISNAFNLPNWPQIKKEDGVYLYKNN